MTASINDMDQMWLCGPSPGNHPRLGLMCFFSFERWALLRSL